MLSNWILPAGTTRERLVLATAEVWMEHGYAGLSEAAICERAGLEPAAFASEFAGVEAAGRAALETPIAAIVSLVGAQFGPDRSEPESCMMGIVAILKLMAANPAYAHVVYVGRRSGKVPARVTDAAATAGSLLVAMLERLRESSAIEEQPPRAGVGALGAAEAVVRREVLAGRTERLLAICPCVVYGATVPFVGQKEALRLARLSEPAAAIQAPDP